MVNTRPSLIIMDVMMPGRNGLSVCRRLSANGGPPVILVTARGEDIDRIIGLEVGADDYLPKPFNPRELVARARAVLRRSARAAPETQATVEVAEAPTISFVRGLEAGGRVTRIYRSGRAGGGIVCG